MPELKIGSREHKELMCRFFTDSFHKFDPEAAAWPQLSPEDLERLRALPIWEGAVKTEANHRASRAGVRPHAPRS